ncbi:FeoA family protein [Clostridium chrysemydis]|uniref:FeoA family protein n=1 Tax=Clostridium chrysemydis TaxID=2665504 RepID=UPI001883BE94|nr:FeoA domain-containing protein [Clostridium chrysemydis]
MVPMAFVNSGKNMNVKRIMIVGDMGKKIREMGFVEDNLIQMIKNDGMSIIVGINGSRLALDKNMARKIIVDEI